MKKIIFSVALLSAGLMFTSCSEDLLDIPQKAVSNIDSFYKTDGDAEEAVSAMYARYIEEIGGNQGIWSAYLTSINYHSDDIFAAGGGTGDHADFRIMNEMRYDASSQPVTQLYSHIYKAVFSANLVISYVGANADTQVKKQAVAEARVMRAWAHMLAAQVYYCPPKIDHLLADDEKPTNVTDQKALYEWCAAEAEAAVADLPERASKDSKEGAWRVTKGFAQFVAAKAALFAGDYQRCANDIKPLVESDKYELVPGDKFRDLFHVEGDGCSEKIFEFNYTTNTAAAGGNAAWLGGNGRGRWMVANVFNWRGDDIVGGGKAPKICSTAGWGGGSINTDFAHKMLANDGDSYRRKATFLTSDEFLYDGDLCGWQSDDYTYQPATDQDKKKAAEKKLTLYKKVEKDGMVNYEADEKGNLVRDYTKPKTYEDKLMDPERGIRNSNGSFSRSDVMEVKMMMHPNDCAEGAPVGDNCNQTNVCLARLAEAYLIYAEACIQTNQFDEAKKYINMIQERAGSKTITEAISGKDDGMKVLMDEKQYELWFEGCRWFDIVRWGIAKECFDKVLDNIPYQFDEYWESKGTKPHKLRYDVKHPFKDEVHINLEFVKGKNEYWPIPQSNIDVNPAVHQVYGAWVK